MISSKDVVITNFSLLFINRNEKVNINKMTTESKSSEITEKEIDEIAKYFMVDPWKKRTNVFMPSVMGQLVIKSKEEKMIESTMESCAFKSLMSCVLGMKK